MKKVLSVVCAAVIASGALALGAGAAFSEPNDDSAGAPGQVFKECFGTNYGQSGLNYGDTKDDPHPGEPYGLPQLLEAHGPNGAKSLCTPAPAPAPKPATPAVATPAVTG